MNDEEKKEEQKEVIMRIKGMTCTSFATSIGNNLKKMDVVKRTRASYRKYQTTVIIDESDITVENMWEVIARAGDEPGDYELVEG